MNKKLKRRTAKDFCSLWATLYQKKYNGNYHTKWLLDGAAFRRLMATYSNAVLTKMIKFVFNDDTTATTFLRSTGYNVVVFERGINQYYQLVTNKANKLTNEIPYWDDVKFSFIVTCVNSGDIASLKLFEYNEESNKTWMLLLRLVKEQNVEMSYKFELFYNKWKRLFITRSRISRRK